MPAHLDCHEFGRTRYRWDKSVRLPCNWKVALEAVDGGHLVTASHPRFLDCGADERTNGLVMGRHGIFEDTPAAIFTAVATRRCGGWYPSSAPVQAGPT